MSDGKVRTLRCRWPIFAQDADNWRGRTVEVWDDGMATLDSGLFSHERHARGELPFKTLVITPEISGGEIQGWIEQMQSLASEPNSEPKQ